jgi:peptidoglycan hydrolase-like protein with peptidoglycan-binding domain
MRVFQGRGAGLVTVTVGVLTAAGVAVAFGLAGSAAADDPVGAPQATRTGTAVAQPKVATVPFEVQGELPVYPEALLRVDDRSAEVRNLEARLIQLKLLDKQYLDDSFGTMTRSAVRKFQRSQGIPPLGYVDQHTWDELAASTHEPTRTELFPPPPKPIEHGGSKLDVRCSTGRVLCIDKSTRRLRWVVDGNVLMSTEVRFGSQFTPTREGQFSVYWKSRNHVSKLYDSKMPFAMFFSGGQAVHYSSDFAAQGYNGASHGCVNVRNWPKIERLFGQVRVGDKVVVYRS